MKYSSKDLIKGTSIYTISKFIKQSGGILLLPVFTRLLTPAQYGIVGLIKPISRFIPLFFVFGLNIAQMRKYFDLKNDKKKIGSLIFTLNIFLWVVNIGVILFFITPLGQKFIGNFIDYSKVPFYPFVFIALITGFLKVFSLIAKNYYQIQKKYKLIGFCEILFFIIIKTVSLSLIYFFSMGALGKIVGGLVGSVIIFLIYYPGYIKKININFNMDKLKNSLGLGVPVMFTAAIGIIINYSDRLIMGKYLEMDIIGIYSLAYTGGMVLSVFYTSFNETWRPMFYNLMDSKKKNKNELIKKIMTNFTIALAGLSLVGELFGKELIILVLPEEYLGAARFLPYILVAMVLAGMNFFSSNFIIYFKENYVTPIFMTFAAVINIIINIMLIPKYGALIAAISTIISFAVLGFIEIVFVKLRYKIDYVSYFKILAIIFFIFNPFLFYLINQPVNTFFILIKFLYLGLFSLIFGKKLFIFFKKTLEKKYEKK